MHPAASQIEKLFLPDLEMFASQMRERYPALNFDVWKWPTEAVGQGFDLGVECVFHVASDGIPNNVALIIELCYLNSKPRIMGSVVWGHPSGHPEVEFRNDCLTNAEWPEANPETIEALRGFLPTLIRAFESAVKRGMPRA